MKFKVLFLCLGNICRSPMAEGVFKSIVEKEGLSDSFLIDSAGTSDYHIGAEPDSRAIQTCIQKNVFLDHKGRQLHGKDLLEYDYIIPMDQKNMDHLLLMSKETPGSKAAFFKMRDFDLLHKGQDVPDPYYGGEEGFYDVFDMLERSSYELLRYIRKEHSL